MTGCRKREKKAEAKVHKKLALCASLNTLFISLAAAATTTKSLLEAYFNIILAAATAILV